VADPDSAAEVFDCATCDRPKTHCEGCPIQYQPKALAIASRLLRLHRRMERTGALPQAGGLLDQDERLMARLDMVARVVGEHEARKRRGGGDIERE